RLSAVFARLERKREVRFKIIDRKQLGVFDLEPLCSERGNRRHFDGESRVGSVFALLTQQSGVDRLQREVFVYLLRAALFEDNSRYANVSIANGEIRDGRGCRDQENIAAFLDAICPI